MRDRTSLRAFRTAAIELEAVTCQREALLSCVSLDQAVEVWIVEFRYRPALAADKVVVVTTARHLVTDRAVLKGNATNEEAVLEELHRAEDRRPPHIWHRRAEVFDRERSR